MPSRPINLEEDEDARRTALVESFNKKFVDSLRPLAVAVETDLRYVASATLTSLFHGSLSTVYEASELTISEIKDLQTFGEVNSGTLTELQTSVKRGKRYQDLLAEKAKQLEQEKADFEKKQAEDKKKFEEELARKQSWIKVKQSEVSADLDALRKSEQVHEKMEDFVQQAMVLFRDMKNSDAGVKLEWMKDFEFTSEGIKALSAKSVYEKIFSEAMDADDSTAEKEMEKALGVLEKNMQAEKRSEKVGETPIEILDNKGENMPPPVSIPRAKKAPFGPPSSPAAKEIPSGSKKDRPAEVLTKATPKGYEKKEKEYVKPEERNEVPREELGGLEVKQETWDLMGRESRQRLLQECAFIQKGEKCYFCGGHNHRAYFCHSMLLLGHILSGYAKQE